MKPWALLLLGALGGACYAQQCPPRVGAEASGTCTAVRTSFGCFTQVDGGRIVGRVCSE